MAIAIIIAGLVVPKLINRSDKALYEETRRLNALIGLASEQALIQGRDVGLSIENQEYHFYIYDFLQRSWLPLATEGSFRSRTLPHNIRLDLSVEESDLVWPEDEESDSDENTGSSLSQSDSDDKDEDSFETPQVLLLSTGEITPFTIFLRMDNLDTAFELTATIDGEREILKHEYGL